VSGGIVHEALAIATGLAAYRWGCLVLEASRLAPADAQVLKNVFAGTFAGTMPAETAAEQRASIAVLHELIHFQQDVATGLGAWDHVVTRDAYPRLVFQSKWLMTPEMSHPFRESALQQLDGMRPDPSVS
jgi:hypothetical protein